MVTIISTREKPLYHTQSVSCFSINAKISFEKRKKDKCLKKKKNSLTSGNCIGFTGPEEKLAADRSKG